jgi:flavin-dependent thymidylate synthase
VPLLWLNVYGWPYSIVVAVKVSQGRTFLKPVEHYVKDYPFWDAVAWAILAVDTPCLERQGYESVLEHVIVQVVARCSRICTHELVRHRLASYAQTSTRVLGLEAFRPDEEKPGLLYPLVEKAAKGDIDALRTLCVIPEWDDGSVEEACRRYFAEIIRHGGKGVDMWLRYGQPDALAAHIMITTNLRELLHIAELRLHPHAHWEIRSLIGEIADKLWEKHLIPFHLMLLLKRPGLAKLYRELVAKAEKQLAKLEENLEETSARKLRKIFHSILQANC